MNESGQKTSIFPSMSWILIGLPYLVIGLLIIIGVITKEINSSPYAKQTDVDKLALIVTVDHDKLDSSIDKLENIANIIDRMQTRQDKLDEAAQTNSLHIEGLEADQKADESAALARRHK